MGPSKAYGPTPTPLCDGLAPENIRTAAPNATLGPKSRTAPASILGAASNPAIRESAAYFFSLRAWDFLICKQASQFKIKIGRCARTAPHPDSRVWLLI